MIWIASFAVGLLVWTLLPSPVKIPRHNSDSLERQRAVPIDVLAAAIAFGVVIFLAPRWWWLALIGCVVACTVNWLIQRARAARQRAEITMEVMHGCSVLSAQLRIGQIPSRALQTAASDVAFLRPAWVCQQVGGEVSTALMQLAQRPGAGGLKDLARAWQLCELSGASLAPAVQQVTAGQRAASATRRTVDAELAAAKATGRLLACLPIFGIGFGYVAGGDPIKFLTTTIVGQACLTLAVCLASAGLIWTEKLAGAIEQELNGQ